MKSTNEIRTELRTELMSFSKVVNRIENVIPFVNMESKRLASKNLHQNGIFLEILENKPYAFLNFCLNKVLVFNGYHLDKSKYTEDMLFNLCCAILKLSKIDTTAKLRKGKEMISITQKGFDTLAKEFEASKLEISTTVESVTV